MSNPTERSEPAEYSQIRATALDYVEGWCTADPARMERALHPDLVKRAYIPGPNGKPQILHLTALALVQFTRESKDKRPHTEVKILDLFEGIASVRVTMTKWVDYIHMVKVGGEWKIINILWELTSEQWAARGGTPGERTR